MDVRQLLKVPSCIVAGYLAAYVQPSLMCTVHICRVMEATGQCTASWQIALFHGSFYLVSRLWGDAPETLILLLLQG